MGRSRVASRDCTLTVKSLSVTATWVCVTLCVTVGILIVLKRILVIGRAMVRNVGVRKVENWIENVGIVKRLTVLVLLIGASIEVGMGRIDRVEMRVVRTMLVKVGSSRMLDVVNVNFRVVVMIARVWLVFVMMAVLVRVTVVTLPRVVSLIVVNFRVGRRIKVGSRVVMRMVERRVTMTFWVLRRVVGRRVVMGRMLVKRMVENKVVLMKDVGSLIVWVMGLMMEVRIVMGRIIVATAVEMLLVDVVTRIV